MASLFEVLISNYELEDERPDIMVVKEKMNSLSCGNETVLIAILQPDEHCCSQTGALGKW